MRRTKKNLPRRVKEGIKYCLLLKLQKKKNTNQSIHFNDPFFPNFGNYHLIFAILQQLTFL